MAAFVNKDSVVTVSHSSNLAEGVVGFKIKVFRLIKNAAGEDVEIPMLIHEEPGTVKSVKEYTIKWIKHLENQHFRGLRGEIWNPQGVKVVELPRRVEAVQTITSATRTPVEAVETATTSN